MQLWSGKPAPRAQCEGFCPQQVLWTIATKWGVFRKEVGASLPGERSRNPDTVPTTRTSARLRLRQCWASIFPADLRLDESPIRDSGGRNLPHGELDLPEREVGFDISHVWLPIIVFGGDPIVSRLVSRPPGEKVGDPLITVCVSHSCAGWDRRTHCGFFAAGVHNSALWSENYSTRTCPRVENKAENKYCRIRPCSPISGAASPSVNC